MRYRMTVVNMLLLACCVLAVGILGCSRTTETGDDHSQLGNGYLSGEDPARTQARLDKIHQTACELARDTVDGVLEARQSLEDSILYHRPYIRLVTLADRLGEENAWWYSTLQMSSVSAGFIGLETDHLYPTQNKEHWNWIDDHLVAFISMSCGGFEAATEGDIDLTCTIWFHGFPDNLKWMEYAYNDGTVPPYFQHVFNVFIASEYADIELEFTEENEHEATQERYWLRSQGDVASMLMQDICDKATLSQRE